MGRAEPAPVLLVVEDENDIRRFVRASLESEGWQVHEADTVARGLIEAGTRKPDVVILDLGLPDRDGVSFIHEIRKWSELPILILSARTEEADKISALDAGADDYLTKPFGVGELLARVRALLRRRVKASGVDAQVVSFGENKIDLVNRLVERAGKAVHLTPIEYRLLSVLLTHPGKVLTQRVLLREVWGPSHAEQSHYLRIYMGHLRQKLEADPAQPVHLVTEPGVGYRFVSG
jgi:two-component system, OmpR family, KDP operon response regulator KdpE